MQVFRQHSSLEDPSWEDVSGSIYQFVLGFHAEIVSQIQQNVICWQSKSLDEILKYAKYCSDSIDAKLKKIKEKYMLVHTKLDQRVEQRFFL